MVVGIFCMVGVVALWSIIPVVAKFVMRTFDPFTLAFLRLSQATLFLLLYYVARGGKLRALVRGDRWILVGALGLTVNYTFFNLSLTYTTASVGILVVQAQIVILTALAAVFFKERVSPLKVCGMAVVVCGVLLVVWGRQGVGELLGPAGTVGNLTMLIAASGWAVYALANKALLRRRGTLEIVIPVLGLGAFSTGLIAVTQFQVKAAVSLRLAGMLLVLGLLSTGFCVYLLSEGLKRLSAALGGTITSLSPLLSILLAGWLLDERIGWQVLGSAGLIISGILIGAYAEHKSANRARVL